MRIRLGAAVLSLWMAAPASAAAPGLYCPEGMTCLAQADQGPSLEDLGFTKSQTEANPERQALLDKRSHMLQVHQRLGLITAVPLAAAFFTGPGRHASSSQLDLHAAIGSTAVTMYFLTAYYAIAAPKVPGAKAKGPTKIHKALAWIHFPLMVLTPILGATALAQRDKGESVHGIASIHQEVATTAFLTYLAAAGVVMIRF